MIVNRFVEWIGKRLSIHAMCEALTCKRCGQEYASRGKYDPGYCKQCEEDMKRCNNVFIGGPLGK